jgi:hypothetical protein
MSLRPDNQKYESQRRTVEEIKQIITHITSTLILLALFGTLIYALGNWLAN